MKLPDHEIDAYLEGELSREQARALEQWINEKPDNAAAFLQIVQTHRILGEHGREQMLSLELEQDRDTTDADFIALLETAQANADPGEASSLNTAIQDVGWAVGKVFRRAIFSTPAALSGIAALLLVGLYLTGAFDRPTPVEPIADLPATDSAVATLVSMSDAQWQTPNNSTPTEGMPIQPGTRLTLTAGQATFTTRRGAVATIQAPCTVQFIDHDNAIRLHAGKLVGVCETRSSKGFFVRTPQMDVVDLGTRFGVDASNPTTTQVHVFEGEVEVATRPGEAQTEPMIQKLVAGQGVKSITNSDALTRTAYDPVRFDGIGPNVIQVFGTGKALALGDQDHNWQVITINGEPQANPTFLVVGGVPSGGDRSMPGNDPATSQWLHGSAVQAAGAFNKERVFTCRTEFELPAGVDPDTARLYVQFDADERIDHVRLNGQSFSTPANSFKDERVELNNMVFPGPFLDGQNTIEFDVVDLIRNSGTTWGFRIQAYIEISNTHGP